MIVNLPVVNLRCECAHCQKPMRRRSVLNDPAFCDYDCARLGQPQHVRAVIRPSQRENPE